MSRFLITGGCGFIGSHLAEALIASGHDVVLLDNLSTGRIENVPHSARLIVGDAVDAETVTEAIYGADGVFHLAAIASVARCNEQWAQSHRINVGAAVTVMEAARDQGRISVVYASSAAVYGDAGTEPISELHVPAPFAAYGVDKYACELHAGVAERIHGVPTCGVRPFNVYGPRQNASSPYSGVISIFAERMARGRPIDVFGDGMQSRDFIAVSDVVRFFIAAMNSCGTGPAVVNAATGRATNILEVIRSLSVLLEVEPEILFHAPRAGDIRQSLGDPTLGRTALGVTAETTLHAGLERMLNIGELSRPTYTASEVDR